MENRPQSPLLSTLYSNNTTGSHNISNSNNSTSSNIVNHGTILVLSPDSKRSSESTARPGDPFPSSEQLEILGAIDRLVLKEDDEDPNGSQAESSSALIKSPATLNSLPGEHIHHQRAESAGVSSFEPTSWQLIDKQRRPFTVAAISDVKPSK